jgi:hypothetical protein
MPTNASASFLWVPNCVYYRDFFCLPKPNFFRTFSKWCEKSPRENFMASTSSSASRHTRFFFSISFFLLVAPLLVSVHIWNSLWCPFSLTKYVLHSLLTHWNSYLNFCFCVSLVVFLSQTLLPSFCNPISLYTFVGIYVYSTLSSVCNLLVFFLFCRFIFTVRDSTIKEPKRKIDNWLFWSYFKGGRVQAEAGPLNHKVDY